MSCKRNTRKKLTRIPNIRELKRRAQNGELTLSSISDSDEDKTGQQKKPRIKWRSSSESETEDDYVPTVKVLVEPRKSGVLPFKKIRSKRESLEKPLPLQIMKNDRKSLTKLVTPERAFAHAVSTPYHHVNESLLQWNMSRIARQSSATPDVPLPQVDEQLEAHRSESVKATVEDDVVSHVKPREANVEVLSNITIRKGNRTLHCAMLPPSKEVVAFESSTDAQAANPPAKRQKKIIKRLAKSSHNPKHEMQLNDLRTTHELVELKLRMTMIEKTLASVATGKRRRQKSRRFSGGLDNFNVVEEVNDLQEKQKVKETPVVEEVQDVQHVKDVDVEEMLQPVNDDEQSWNTQVKSLLRDGEKEEDDLKKETPKKNAQQQDLNVSKMVQELLSPAASPRGLKMIQMALETKSDSPSHHEWVQITPENVSVLSPRKKTSRRSRLSDKRETQIGNNKDNKDPVVIAIVDENLPRVSQRLDFEESPTVQFELPPGISKPRDSLMSKVLPPPEDFDDLTQLPKAKDSKKPLVLLSTLLKRNAEQAGVQKLAADEQVDCPRPKDALLQPILDDWDDENNAKPDLAANTRSNYSHSNFRGLELTPMDELRGLQRKLSAGKSLSNTSHASSKMAAVASMSRDKKRDTLGFLEDLIEKAKSGKITRSDRAKLRSLKAASAEKSPLAAHDDVNVDLEKTPIVKKQSPPAPKPVPVPVPRKRRARKEVPDPPQLKVASPVFPIEPEVIISAKKPKPAPRSKMPALKGVSKARKSQRASTRNLEMSRRSEVRKLLNCTKQQEHDCEATLGEPATPQANIQSAGYQHAKAIELFPESDKDSEVASADLKQKYTQHDAQDVVAIEVPPEPETPQLPTEHTDDGVEESARTSTQSTRLGKANNKGKKREVTTDRNSEQQQHADVDSLHEIEVHDKPNSSPGSTQNTNDVHEETAPKKPAANMKEGKQTVAKRKYTKKQKQKNLDEIEVIPDIDTPPASIQHEAAINEEAVPFNIPAASTKKEKQTVGKRKYTKKQKSTQNLAEIDVLPDLDTPPASIEDLESGRKQSQPRVDGLDEIQVLMELDALPSNFQNEDAHEEPVLKQPVTSTKQGKRKYTKRQQQKENLDNREVPVAKTKKQKDKNHNNSNAQLLKTLQTTEYAPITTSRFGRKLKLSALAQTYLYVMPDPIKEAKDESQKRPKAKHAAKKEVAVPADESSKNKQKLKKKERNADMQAPEMPPPATEPQPTSEMPPPATEPQPTSEMPPPATVPQPAEEPVVAVPELAKTKTVKRRARPRKDQPAQAPPPVLPQPEEAVPALEVDVELDMDLDVEAPASSVTCLKQRLSDTMLAAHHQPLTPEPSDEEQSRMPARGGVHTCTSNCTAKDFNPAILMTKCVDYKTIIKDENFTVKIGPGVRDLHMAIVSVKPGKSMPTRYNSGCVLMGCLRSGNGTLLYDAHRLPIFDASFIILPGSYFGLENVGNTVELEVFIVEYSSSSLQSLENIWRRDPPPALTDR